MSAPRGKEFDQDQIIFVDDCLEVVLGADDNIVIGDAKRYKKKSNGRKKDGSHHGSSGGLGDGGGDGMGEGWRGVRRGS